VRQVSSQPSQSWVVDHPAVARFQGLDLLDVTDRPQLEAHRVHLLGDLGVAPLTA